MATRLDQAYEAMQHIRYGILNMVDATKSLGDAIWTQNGNEQVAVWGYDVLSSSGEVIGRVSTYVHLVGDATPEDFVEAEA